MVPRMPNRQYAYFRDDQIVCVMTHTQDRLTEANLDAWRHEIEDHPALKEPKVTLAWPPRWFSFRNLGDNEYFSSAAQPRFLHAFSTVFCEMKNVSPDPLEFLNFISNLSNPNTGLIGNTFAQLKIEAISPNWLASSTSQSGGTGGPGSWPVPYRGNPSRAPYQFRDLISNLNAWGIYGDGEGVDVAILDTAPCPHDLVAAYKECKSWHPLIQTLLGPNGKLKLYPATYEESLRMGNTSLNRHDYKMTDHGLFVASIVHSIVPQAQIHLIEVLNQFGVGDLESLSGGFQKVLDEIYQEPPAPAESEQPQERRRRLVVNCSWMLDLPRVPEHLQALSFTDPEYAFEQAVLQLVSHDEENQALALRGKCDRLMGLGRQVVAAAGNDWKGKSSGSRIPATRFPGAFLSTFGVGALPKDSIPDPITNKWESSSYSNLADVPDDPNVKKIATLGGEEGEERGVLGLYLGEFPGCEPQPNCTKWAWWAGTSFATPIFTGAIAAVLSKTNGPEKTQDAVDLLFQPVSQPDQKVIVERNGTPSGEDVMEATQVY